MYDQVAQTRLYRFWNTPPRRHRRRGAAVDRRAHPRRRQDLAALRAARLPRAAGRHGQRGPERVRDRGPVQHQRRTSRPASSRCGSRRAIEEELRRFIDKGPTRRNWSGRARRSRAGFLKGLERIGGFGGKADVLAACEVYEGDPGCYRRSLELLDSATAEQVRDAAQRWLSQGDYTLEVHPVPRLPQRRGERRGPQHRACPRRATFPASPSRTLERRTLAQRPAGDHRQAARRAGGARVGAVRRRLSPPTRAASPAPRASPWACSTRARASLGALAIADARRVARCRPERRLVARHLVRRRVGAEGAARRVRRAARRRGAQPGLPARGDRARAQGVDRRHRREKTSPDALASRLLPPLLYGDGHPYAIPFTGSGTEASIAAR